MSLYDKLDSTVAQVRLLRLSPGQEMDDVRGTLSVASLSEQPEYTALSYVWGDPNVTTPITVNGAQLEVTVNLELALRHIRMPEVEKVLWVDAVCINQDDDQEKSQQVPLMRDLYTRAPEVIIWLGAGDKYSDMLADIINEKRLPSRPGDDVTDSVEFERLYEEYMADLLKVIALLKRLCRRPWWTRVWTVQECILPINDPIFRCGSKTFSWAAFFQIFNELYPQLATQMDISFKLRPEDQDLQQTLEERGSGESMGFYGIVYLNITREGTRRKSGMKSLDLDETVVYCIGREASREHDYVYGSLGLASQERQKIVIDYTVSHWEAYRQLIEPIMLDENPKGHEILALFSFDPSPRNQPSWIPDLSRQKNSRYSGMTLYSSRPWRSVTDIRLSHDNEILMVRGVLLDLVESVYALVDEQKDWLDNLTGLHEILGTLRSQADRREVRHHIPTVPGPLVDASRNCHPLQPLLARIGMEPRAEQLVSSFWWDVMMDPKHEKSQLLHGPESRVRREDLGGESIMNVTQRMLALTQLACGGRNLAVSRGGLAGITVPHAAPGDVIVGVFGWDMLMVLRPCKHFYTIVGAIFVGGLMDWKVLDECYDRGELAEATFRIR